MDKLFLPEIYKDIKIPNMIESRSLHIKKIYDFIVENDNFVVRVDMGRVNDNSEDVIKISTSKETINYRMDVVKDVVQKYLIVNGSVKLECINNSCNGYLFGTWSTSGNLEDNKWNKDRTRLKDGMRILYIPNEWKFVNINDRNVDMFCFMYVNVPTSGHFRLTVVKNINMIPWDKEFFECDMVKDANNYEVYKNQIIISDGSAKTNVV